MKMKISDVIRKVNDNDMAKIIGATVAQHIDGISAPKAAKLDYPNTLQTLQKEIEVDYKLTNAERIRSMSDEELADFLVHVETQGYYDQSISGTLGMFEWLQSEVEE